jgi:Fur family ferric uptake transcriptional regulator
MPASAPAGRSVDERAAREWADRARETLKRRGHRSGGAREKVIDFLARQRCLLSAHDVTRSLHDGGERIGTASVYRALDTLAQLDLLERHEISGITHFELADGDRHHHHVVCGSCGRIASFSDRDLESALTGLARRLDFDVDQHDVLLHGRCAGCRTSAV